MMIELDRGCAHLISGYTRNRMQNPTIKHTDTVEQLVLLTSKSVHVCACVCRVPGRWLLVP
jgi:hypothetical protein